MEAEAAREPPADVSTEKLQSCLSVHYGLDVTQLTFLPLGHDSRACVYRARTSQGHSFFLKARRSVTNQAGLVVPRYLKEHGVEQVVAPLLTQQGSLWAAADDYALVLYPFISGETGTKLGLSERQWTDFGATLRQIHSTIVTSELARILRRDVIKPAGVDMVRGLDIRIQAESFDDPLAGALAAAWRARRDTVWTLQERVQHLGERLARKNPHLVLCHADVHTGNVLLDTDGRVWIADWDETLLAARERDLMFVIGGGISRALVGLHEEAWFLRGYGPVTTDPLALAYYRCAWAVGDIGAFAEEVIGRPDLDPRTKQRSLNQFLKLFAPGNIVELALESSTS